VAFSSAVPVCPPFCSLSACVERIAGRWAHFYEVSFWEFSQRAFKKTQFCPQFHKITDTWHENQVTLLQYLAEIFPE